MEGADPNDIENPHIQSPERSLMEELKRLSPPSRFRCIYRVPDRLHHVRPEDYTPRVISIGPFHHGNKALKAMEVHKMWYFKCFLERTKLEPKDCIGKIKAKEDQLRDCYGETIDFGSDEFAKIILVDAIFLIEFLRSYKQYWCRECQNENDCIFGKPRMVDDEHDCIFGKPMMVKDVVPDLLMLENQLPFFILEDLDGLDRPNIKELARRFLCCQGTTDFGVCLSEKTFAVEEHFVNLYRELLIAPISKAQKKESQEKKSRVAPSIEMLHLAGVKLKVPVIKSTSEHATTNLFDIQFNKGTLQIPKLKTGDWTELVLRNLLAFEQCSSTCDDYYISDYVIFMDELVNTPKDVELLAKYGIVENNLGGAHHELSSLINRLSTGLMYHNDNFYYGNLYDRLHKFYSSKWHMWMANLRRNYFNTPWTTISFVVAVVLLLLTAIQTVFSVHTFK